MSKALEETIERLRRQAEAEGGKAKEWHGRANYHSPRSAESWEAPKPLLRFDQNPAEGALKVMETYRRDILAERGVKPAAQVVAERRSKAREERGYAKWQDGTASRLTPFEDAFRVSPDEAEDERRRKTSWLKRLFGRK